eukprot:6692073-Prymnesium_polylepis.1
MRVQATKGHQGPPRATKGHQGPPRAGTFNRVCAITCGPRAPRPSWSHPGYPCQASGAVALSKEVTHIQRSDAPKAPSRARASTHACLHQLDVLEQTRRVLVQQR